VDTPAAAPVTGESRPAAAVPGGGAGRAEPGDTSRGGDATAAGTGGASASSHRAGGSSFGGGAGTQTALALPGGGSGVGAEYGPYLTALRQRIQQSVRYPASARRRGISGTVDLEILILPNGLVGGVQVVESSTHQILDEAALESVRALPRMPLPRDLPQRALRVRVPVVFQIQ
jgi:protein TonB